MSELDYVLKKMRKNKAPGEDRIPAEFYKCALVEFKELLLKVFNKIFVDGVAPESFTRSIIFPLHKKGDIGDISNYRGISFMDSMATIFAGILREGLEEWERSKKIIKENQAGFCAGYSAVDNIFVLHSIINYYLYVKKKKMYGFFIDFKAAFDCLDREALFFKLSQLGVSNKFVNIIKGLYNSTSSKVWCKGGLT